MNNVLRYKGFTSGIEYDADSEVLFGKLDNISDLVTFESKSADGIIKEFQAAVDDYINFCAEVGKALPTA